MSRQVALLRGVNVGGAGKLAMADFRALLVGLGARDVASWVQSGNAVFDSDMAPDALAPRLEAAIEAAHGFRPRALILEAREFAAIAAAYPFAAAWQAPKTGHVWFMAAPPPAPDLDRAAALAAPDERLALTGRAFYLQAPAGIGRSKLAGRVEALLGVPATARNLNTVARLAQMLATPAR